MVHLLPTPSERHQLTNVALNIQHAKLLRPNLHTTSDHTSLYSLLELPTCASRELESRTSFFVRTQLCQRIVLAILVNKQIRTWPNANPSWHCTWNTGNFNWEVGGQTQRNGMVSILFTLYANSRTLHSTHPTIIKTNHLVQVSQDSTGTRRPEEMTKQQQVVFRKSESAVRAN